MIKRYGTDKGLKKWEEYKNKISFANSEDGYIIKYGEKEGKKKFKEQCIRNAGNLTLERKQELLGDAIGLEEFNKMKVTLSERHSLENYIRLYGEEEGTEKYLKLCEIRAYKNSLAYYVEKYGEEEGTKKIKEVKDNSSLKSLQMKFGKEYGYEQYTTFNLKKLNTKENFIKRHGLKDGLKRWESYSKKILRGYSIVSEELFKSLNKPDAFYGENEQTIILTSDECVELNQSLIRPDFILGNKIIEFNGDFWHGNLEVFPEDYKIPNIDMMASDKRLFDLKRNELLRKKGYKVKVIWENDYTNNKEIVIKECLDFLDED